MNRFEIGQRRLAVQMHHLISTEIRNCTGFSLNENIYEAEKFWQLKLSWLPDYQMLVKKNEVLCDLATNLLTQ